VEDDCLEKGSRGSRFTSAYNFEKSPWGKEEWNGTSCRRFSFLFSPSIVTCTCFPFFSFLTFESCYVPFKIGLSLYFLFLSCSKLPLISFCFLNSFSFQIYFYLFVPFSASSEKSNYDIQTALVIHGFVYGLDYSRPMNCVQNLLSKDIVLAYSRIVYLKMEKRARKRYAWGQTVVTRYSRYIHRDVTPADNEGFLSSTLSFFWQWKRMKWNCWFCIFR